MTLGWRSHGWGRSGRVAWSALALGLGLWAQTTATQTAKPDAAWQTSAAVTQGMDSNIFMSFDHPTTAATTDMQLSLARHWLWPHSGFSLLYVPTGEIFAGHSELNYFGQSGAADWSYRWRHTTLDWSSHAERMPERAGNLQAGLSGVAAVASNTQAMALATVLSGAMTGLRLTHQYSLRSSWSANVSAGLQSFTQDKRLAANLAAGSSALQQPQSNAHTLGAGLGWSYQMTPRRSFGLNAGQTEMFYAHPSRRLLYTNVEASLTQQLSSAVSVFVRGGPAWNHTSGTLTRPLPGQSYSAGAGIDLVQGQTHYGASWSHAETAGYVPGGITTDTLALDYGLSWGRSWSGSISLGRSLYRGFYGVTPAGGAGGEHSVYAAAQLSYRIATAWTMQAWGSYSTQTLPMYAETGVGGPAVAISQPIARGRYGVGLFYQPGGAR